MKSFSWCHPTLEVRESHIGGKGLYATQVLPRGGLLVVLGGRVMTRKEESELPAPIRDIACQITPNLVLGITSEDELDSSSYINHSCEPNMGFKGQIFLVAIREISPNDELTFDYSMVLHNSLKSSSYKLECKCNAASCRGTITENDWKIPALRAKYKGYFQYYLEEKINNKDWS